MEKGKNHTTNRNSHILASHKRNVNVHINIITCILMQNSKSTQWHASVFKCILHKSRFFPGGGEKWCVPWDNLFSATKITPFRGVEGLKKNNLRLLAAHTNVLRSNLSGVLFASYFNKGAQWVYQTALMNGLLARLPACTSTRPGVCVYYQSALCLQLATSSTPLTPLPHTQTATFTGASPVPRTPPPTKPLLHHSCTHTHTVHHQSHTFSARCTCSPIVNNAPDMHLHTCEQAHT